MKYILITLLSFTFATQITTREFEIEIPVDSPDGYQFYANIDIFDYIELEYVQITPITISGFLGGYGSMVDMQLGGTFCTNYDGYFQDCQGGYGMMVTGNSNIDIYGEVYGEGSSVGDSITFKFWAKGAFEDEDTSMGDMNNDGSLNVYDVLIMVGIILDGDSGDIFDVMEIIKRV